MGGSLVVMGSIPGFAGYVSIVWALPLGFKQGHFGNGEQYGPKKRNKITRAGSTTEGPIGDCVVSTRCAASLATDGEAPKVPSAMLTRA